MWQLGETAEARMVVNRLTESAVINGSMVHWQGTTGDGYYDHKTMASDTRSTALVLSALVQIEPGHNLEAGTVRWLMAQRRATGWGTTNETSYAILGLTDHLLAVQAAGNSNPTTYTVELDGTVVEQGVLAAALGTTLRTPPPTSSNRAKILSSQVIPAPASSITPSYNAPTYRSTSH
ncbi:MAG: hypothetical protein IPL78_34590 [Chloroflexi bacterium]|nr:hypothetical protein [Chloroflexota bacterium]